MNDREELIKKLHASKRFQAALENARTPEERASLQRAGEMFVSSFAGLLESALEKAKSDPTFREQLGRAVVQRQGVVTSEPVTSGSIG